MFTHDRYTKLLIYAIVMHIWRRKNVADYVPKSIMSFMVNTAKDVMQRELVSQLYKDGKNDAFNWLTIEPIQLVD